MSSSQGKSGTKKERKMKKLFTTIAAIALAAVTVVPTAGAQDRNDTYQQAPTTREAPHRHTGPGDLVSNGGDTCMGREITIWASQYGVTNGTSGSDVIAGTDGNDVIYGRGGNDVICGFDGDDIIYGDHNDPDDPDGGLDTINGGKGDDDIYGGPRQDFIQGSSGNDVIWGDIPTSNHGTQDNIEGGNGNDVIVGGPGSDLVWGDRMFAFGEREQGYGNDVIDAVTDNAGGHDEVWAGAGNDRIFAKDGIGQNAWGGSGRDTCAVDEKVDVWSSCETLE